MKTPSEFNVVKDSTSMTMLHRLQNESKDDDIWDYLHIVYAPMICHWIRIFGVTKPEEVEDVFQDVCLRLYKSIKNFHREDGIAKFRKFLKLIARSAATDHIRKSPQESPRGGTSVVDIPAPVNATDNRHEVEVQLFELRSNRNKAQLVVNDIQEKFASESFLASSSKQAIDGEKNRKAEVETEIVHLDNQIEKIYLLQGLIKAVKEKFKETTWKSYWRVELDGLNAKQAADELEIGHDAARKNVSRVRKFVSAYRALDRT